MAANRGLAQWVTGTLLKLTTERRNGTVTLPLPNVASVLVVTPLPQVNIVASRRPCFSSLITVVLLFGTLGALALT